MLNLVPRRGRGRHVAHGYGRSVQRCRVVWARLIGREEQVLEVRASAVIVGRVVVRPWALPMRCYDRAWDGMSNAEVASSSPTFTEFSSAPRSSTANGIPLSISGSEKAQLPTLMGRFARGLFPAGSGVWSDRLPVVTVESEQWFGCVEVLILLVVDVAALGVTIGVLLALGGLGAGVDAIVQAEQEATHQVRPDRVAKPGNYGRNYSGRLRRPAKRVHLVPTCLWVEEGVEGDEQVRGEGGIAVGIGSGLANALGEY